MKINKFYLISKIFLNFIILFGNFSNILAAQENNKLSIPRFVSIKSSEANIRTGPNLKYPIKWIFKNRYEPVEIIAEFEHWKKIKDITNDEGWIHESMITSSRSAVIIGSDFQYGYIKPDLSSKTIVKLEPQVRIKLSKRINNWCQIKIKNDKAWIERRNLWGIYNNEVFNTK